MAGTINSDGDLDALVRAPAGSQPAYGSRSPLCRACSAALRSVMSRGRPSRMCADRGTPHRSTGDPRIDRAGPCACSASTVIMASIAAEMMAEKRVASVLSASFVIGHRAAQSGMPFGPSTLVHQYNAATISPPSEDEREHESIAHEHNQAARWCRRSHERPGPGENSTRELNLFAGRVCGPRQRTPLR